MLEFIKNFFTANSPGYIVSHIVMAVVFTAVYFLMFYYAQKRNLVSYIVWSVIVLVVVFVTSFFIDAKIYSLFAVCAVLVCGVVFFAHDFLRAMFRRSWKRWVNADRTGNMDVSIDEMKNSVSEIIKACQRMSKMDVGALIVISDDISDTVVESGTPINAQITSDLLETIFFPKTPLHDGAVVVMGNRVVSAGCYLPLTQAVNLPREFGTRHRAAIGVSEAYPNATVIVVSEESGIISAVHDGKIKRYLDAEQIRAVLNCAFRLSDEAEEIKVWGLVTDEKE